MKNLKHYLVAITLLIFVQGFAQKNIFLDRKFWDTKPTVETVIQKVKAGNNPSEANGNNFDGVVYATLQDAPLKSIIYLMSQKGNDVNKLTHDGRTYIFWAAYKGNIDLVTYLIKNGAKTDITDDKGNTVINFAAGAGQQNTEVYDVLIKSNPDVLQQTNPNGANALLLAAPNDTDFKLISYFESQGLSIKSTDNEGNGIFNYVATKGQIKMLNSLLEKGLKGTDQAFIMAANGARGTSNGIEVYKYLESVGLNPDVTDTEGVSPLHIVAAKNKDINIVKFFINKGLDVNATDTKGNTAFMNAAANNTLKVVDFLQGFVKTKNITNKKGQSALTLAISNNSADVVAFLIKEGYKTTIIDQKGNNIAYYLVDSYSARNKDEFIKKLEVLEMNNVDVSQVQKNGNTWYHLAVEKNSLDVLKIAEKMNLDINAKNSEGNTALHIAALKAKDDTILKFLLEQGAKKDLVTDFEETAYDLAAENELLKKHNISIKFLK